MRRPVLRTGNNDVYGVRCWRRDCPKPGLHVHDVYRTERGLQSGGPSLGWILQETNQLWRSGSQSAVVTVATGLFINFNTLETGNVSLKLWWGIGDNAYAPQPRDLRLCWKIRTTSTSNQHQQQPFDLRLCWKIQHTTSTPNQHHQQPCSSSSTKVCCSSSSNSSSSSRCSCDCCFCSTGSCSIKWHLQRYQQQKWKRKKWRSVKP